MPPVHDRHPFARIRRGLRLCYVLLVELGRQPVVEDLVADRKERRVTRRVPQVREVGQDPMGALPLGVHVATTGDSAARVAVREEGSYARRPTDVVGQFPHDRRLGLLPERHRPSPPADRRVLVAQERIHDPCAPRCRHWRDATNQLRCPRDPGVRAV